MNQKDREGTIAALALLGLMLFIGAVIGWSGATMHKSNKLKMQQFDTLKSQEEFYSKQTQALQAEYLSGRGK